MSSTTPQAQLDSIDALIGSLQQLKSHISSSADKHDDAAQGTYMMPYTAEAWQAATAARQQFTSLVSLLVNPAQRLGELMFSSVTTHSMNTALDIGLFDAVPAQGAVPIAELSAATKVPAERLAPLMRHIANEGLFAETSPMSNEWQHTHLSRMLRSGGAMHLDVLQAYTRDFIEPSFEHLTPCLRSHKSGYEDYRREHIFSFLAKHPAENNKFGTVMQCMNGIVGSPLAADYDWSRFNGKTIVDVGGGVGALPALLVMPYPDLKFHVQDLEEPVAQGKAFWSATFPPQVAERVTFQAHSFFEPQPEQISDVYLMRFILHDWADADCLKILSALRSSVKAGTTLLVAEILIDADNTSWQRTMSLHMLAVFNAEERTEEQYRSLLKQTGWQLQKTSATSGPLSLLEAVAI
ncbi:S-adenosyl-L-methionine-dependent methyltransferase [Jaminaea rosea]|uniref:S-adenosyl-L-methionine-dependent methyltransferase n=1 Tax=Jaminaea rosea TaxID=1569628 RepID=A0A316UM48_9BASI|nr:S-adenosyl-L-methionine-dependent methyltransferase [Jaminaea rosea]PWN26362.1 S-adenosyl-L-methionine-dependent methyltransferase [Jaminaea rosea]